MKKAKNRALRSLRENPCNRARHGQGLLTQVRKPREMPGRSDGNVGLGVRSLTVERLAYQRVGSESNCG